MGASRAQGARRRGRCPASRDLGTVTGLCSRLCPTEGVEGWEGVGGTPCTCCVPAPPRPPSPAWAAPPSSEPDPGEEEGQPWAPGWAPTVGHAGQHAHSCLSRGLAPPARAGLRLAVCALAGSTVSPARAQGPAARGGGGGASPQTQLRGSKAPFSLRILTLHLLVGHGPVCSEWILPDAPSRCSLGPQVVLPGPPGRALRAPSRCSPCPSTSSLWPQQVLPVPPGRAPHPLKHILPVPPADAPRAPSRCSPCPSTCFPCPNTCSLCPQQVLLVGCSQLRHLLGPTTGFRAGRCPTHTLSCVPACEWKVLTACLPPSTRLCRPPDSAAGGVVRLPAFRVPISVHCLLLNNFSKDCFGERAHTSQGGWAEGENQTPRGAQCRDPETVT